MKKALTKLIFNSTGRQISEKTMVVVDMNEVASAYVEKREMAADRTNQRPCIFITTLEMKSGKIIEVEEPIEQVMPQEWLDVIIPYLVERKLVNHNG